MKNFFALILFMDHVKKDRVKDYWSTDSYVETPIFLKVMPEQI